MNTKKQAIIISGLLVICISALLVVRNSPSKVPNSQKKDSPSVTSTTGTPGMELFTSVDGLLEFEYPKAWYISFTTPKKGRGEFGTYVQTWKVTSFQPDGIEDQLPENSVQLEFEILDNDDKVTLDDVISCEMKSTECTEVTIKKTVYKRDTAVLNIGTRLIRLGTVKKNNVYRVTAQLTSGNNQEKNSTIVEKILQSITLR